MLRMITIQEKSRFCKEKESMTLVLGTIMKVMVS